MLHISGTIHHMVVIFGFVCGLKMQKWPKMTKFCLSHSISQEAYIIWLWFLVHLSKIMTSLHACFILWKFWFPGLLGGGGWGEGGIAKNSPKWQKISISFRISGTVHHMIVIFGTHVEIQGLLYKYLRSLFQFCWMWIFPWIKLSWHSCSVWDKLQWLS